MFKFICIIGLLAGSSALPTQPLLQDVHSTTTTLTASSVKTIPVDSIQSVTEINQVQPVAQLKRTQLVGPPSSPNKRPIIVLHKPSVPAKSLDDQESMEKAASEWYNQWENRWWRNDFNQVGGFDPYDSYGYAWGQPQYAYYKTFLF